MNRMKLLQALTLVIFLASLLSLAAFAMPFFARWPLAALLVVSGYAFFRMEQARRQAACDDRLIQTVSHHRHDWMNDFQVLLGLMKLKKFDSMQPYMDKIKARMHQESCMAKLGSSSLIAYLMSFRADKRPLELEVNVEQETNLAQLNVEKDGVASLLKETVECFCGCAQESDGEPNRLSIEIGLEDTDLLLDFVYDGNYREELLGEAVTAMKKRRNNSRVYIEEEIGQNHVVLTCRFKNAAGRI